MSWDDDAINEYVKKLISDEQLQRALDWMKQESDRASKELFREPLPSEIDDEMR